MHRPLSIDDLGNSAVYLSSEMARGVTGEIHFDATFNNITPVRIAVVRDGEIEIELP